MLRGCGVAVITVISERLFVREPFPIYVLNIKNQ